MAVLKPVPRRWRAVCGRVGPALLLLVALSAAPAVAGAGVGDRVPDMTLSDWQGAPRNLSQMRAPVVVLEFWASWCALCGEGLPALDALSRRYDPKKVEFIAVNIDRSRDRAEEFLSRYLPKPSVTLLQDPEGALMARFGVPSMPSVYLIVDGVVRLIEEGYGEEQIAALERAISAADRTSGNTGR